MTELQAVCPFLAMLSISLDGMVRGVIQCYVLYEERILSSVGQYNANWQMVWFMWYGISTYFVSVLGELKKKIAVDDF